MTPGTLFRILWVFLSLFAVFVTGNNIAHHDHISSVPVVPHMFRTVFAMNSLLYTFVSNSTAYVTSTQFATGISGENGIVSSGNWFYTFRVNIQAANQAAMFTIQKIFHKLNETETKHAFWWHMQGGLADESSATVCSTIPEGPPCYAEGIDLTWLDPRNKLAPHDLSYAGNTTVFSPWGEAMGFENSTIPAGWWRSSSACKDIYIGHIPSVSIQKYIDWVVAERELSRSAFAMSEEVYSHVTNETGSASTSNLRYDILFDGVSDSSSTLLAAHKLSFDAFVQYQAEQMCSLPVLTIRERGPHTDSLLKAEDDWADDCVRYVLNRRLADRSFALNAADTVEQGLLFLHEYLVAENYMRMQPMMETLLTDSTQESVQNTQRTHSYGYSVPSLRPWTGAGAIPSTRSPVIPEGDNNQGIQDEIVAGIANRWNTLSDMYAKLKQESTNAHNPLLYIPDPDHEPVFDPQKQQDNTTPTVTVGSMSLAQFVKDAEVFPNFMTRHIHNPHHSPSNPRTRYSSPYTRNHETYCFRSSPTGLSCNEANDQTRYPPYLYYAPTLASVPNLQDVLSQPVLYSAAEYQPSSGFCNLNNRTYDYHPSLHGFLPLSQASQASELFALPKACENVTTPHTDDAPVAGTTISLLWYIISLCISFIIGCIVFYVFSYTNTKRREEKEADVRNNYLLYEEFQRLNAAYGEQQVQAFPGRVELM